MKFLYRILLSLLVFCFSQTIGCSQSEGSSSVDSTDQLRQTLQYYQQISHSIRRALSQADYIKADELIHKVLITTKDFSGYARILAGLFLSQKGDLLALLGKPKEAVMYYDSSLSVYKFFPPDPQQLIIFTSKGASQLRLNLEKEAEVTFRKADSTFNLLPKALQHPQLIVPVWNRLAGIYGSFNDWDQAFNYLKKSQKLYEGIDSPNYLESAAGLIPYLIRKKLWEEARNEIQKAKRIIARYFRGQHPTLYLIQASEAEVYANLDQLDQGEKNYQNAIDLAIQEQRSASEIAGMYSAFSLFYQKTKINYKKAKQHRLTAIRLLESIEDDHKQLLMAYNDLASLYMKMEEYDLVAEPLMKAQQILQTEQRRNFGLISESRKEIYKEGDDHVFFNTFSFTAKVIQSKSAPLLQELSYNAALYLNGLLLYDSRQFRRAVQQSDDITLIRFYQNWITLKEKRLKAAPDQQKTLLSSIELVEEQILQRLPKSSISSPIQRVTWKEIKEKLLPQQAAITFVRYADYYTGNNTDTDLPKDLIHYAALIIRPNTSVPYFIHLGTETQLSKLINPNFSPSQLYSHSTAQEKDQPVGNSLYNFIWKPIESVLHGIRTVYFTPDGLLHKIAFAALPVGQRNPSKMDSLLSMRHELHQLFSTRQLASGIDTFRWRSSQSAVILGGIKYDTDHMAPRAFTPSPTENRYPNNFLTYFRQAKLAPFRPLLSTGPEVKEIHQLLPGSRILLSAQATEDTLKRLSHRSPTVIHIATHGFFLADSSITDKSSLLHEPLFRSGLALAGANQVWSNSAPNGLEDGILTAYEVSNLDFNRTKLVVLSACESALGDIRGPEGVFGLQRAFRVAGVEKIIMSLWKVSDVPTRFFMVNFYTHLVKNKLDVRKAFQLTQENVKAKFNDPSIWAAFILVD